MISLVSQSLEAFDVTPRDSVLEKSSHPVTIQLATIALHMVAWSQCRDWLHAGQDVLCHRFAHDWQDHLFVTFFAHGKLRQLSHIVPEICCQHCIPIAFAESRLLSNKRGQSLECHSF